MALQFTALALGLNTEIQQYSDLLSIAVIILSARANSDPFLNDLLA